MSHGVNKGVLKRNKIDVREPFVKELISKNKDIIFDIYGYKNNQPIWTIIGPFLVIFGPFIGPKGRKTATNSKFLEISAS